MFGFENAMAGNLAGDDSRKYALGNGGHDRPRENARSGKRKLHGPSAHQNYSAAFDPDAVDFVGASAFAPSGATAFPAELLRRLRWDTRGLPAKTLYFTRARRLRSVLSASFLR